MKLNYKISPPPFSYGFGTVNGGVKYFFVFLIFVLSKNEIDEDNDNLKDEDNKIVN
jgi:hypothetical protein